MSEMKRRYQEAQVFRNEGMLEQCGWTRLSSKFPKDSGGDSEHVYISDVCVFIINNANDSYSNCAPLIGKVFINADGARELFCGNGYDDAVSVDISEVLEESTYWKSIDVPRLNLLEQDPEREA